jgi:hypothetical protein
MEEQNGGDMRGLQNRHKERQDILPMLCLRALVVQQMRPRRQKMHLRQGFS